VRSSAELRCLVRYCLNVAAAQGLENFDGSSIPRHTGFPRVLIGYCKRKWDSDRFRALKHTGVLPEENAIWDGAVKPNVPKAEIVEQFSSSESEVEDEIPAVRPAGGKGKRKRRARE
jgi:hypothetical protein